MAITWGAVERVYRGPIDIVYAEATFDNSYASGGEVVTASLLGMQSIKALIPTATSGYDVTYSKTNDGAGKLVVYATIDPSTNSATAAPVQSSTGRDVSTLVISCVILGKAV